MKDFCSNYMNIVNAAYNKEAERTPLYEHIIVDRFMEKVLNREFAELINGGESDKREFFTIYTGFFREMGYDTVSFEQCVGSVMPGSGALGRHMPGVIKTREDFERYPWAEIPGMFFDQFSDDFRILGEVMPQGMKAIGGPGNGVFECVQELVGYTELCYMAADDPDLFTDLFTKIGEMLCIIWSQFMLKFGDIFAILRFGDDLGFKSDTLLSPSVIKESIIPQYQKIIKIVHSHNKPFLLHSCGCIFSIMDELIDTSKINAKHSNEDQIAPFSVWVERYGDRIGNFGGIDVDVLCQRNEQEIKEYVREVMRYTKGHGGIAIGSGNSIPPYIPVEGFMAMVEAVREYRGDYKG